MIRTIAVCATVALSLGVPAVGQTEPPATGQPAQAAAAPAAAATPAPPLGPVTWNDLRFGMVPDDIQTKLTDSGLTLKPDKTGGGFDVEPEWKWQPQPDSKELFFRVAIGGSPTAGMQKVVLLLDPTEMRKRIPELQVVVDYTATPIQKYMTEKYGAPVATQPACTTSGQQLVNLLIDQEAASCKEAWVSGGQKIAIAWYYYGNKRTFNYLITYEPWKSGQ